MVLAGGHLGISIGGHLGTDVAQRDFWVFASLERGERMLTIENCYYNSEDAQLRLIIVVITKE